ncbi:MAG: hypothetical protein PHP46_04550, partial [Candidatus Omnitrophica bacterium]|nr:hypothetical protein [Candidatus Omnitrophota bacterium]
KRQFGFFKGRIVQVEPSKAEYAVDKEGNRYLVIVAPQGLWVGKDEKGNNEYLIIRNLEDFAKAAGKGYEVRDAEGNPIYDVNDIANLMVNPISPEINNAMFKLLNYDMVYRHKKALERLDKEGFSLEVANELAETNPLSLIRLIKRLSEGAANIFLTKSGDFKIFANFGIDSSGKMFSVDFVYTIDLKKPHKLNQLQAIWEKGEFELKAGGLEDITRFYADYNKRLEILKIRKVVVDERDRLAKDLAEGRVKEEDRKEMESKKISLDSEIARYDNLLIDVEDILREDLYIPHGTAFPLSDKEITPEEIVAQLKSSGKIIDETSLVLFEQQLNVVWARHKINEALVGPWSIIRIIGSIGSPTSSFTVSIERDSGLMNLEFTREMAYLEFIKAQTGYNCTTDWLTHRKSEVEELLEKVLPGREKAINDWIDALKKRNTTLEELKKKAQVTDLELQAAHDELIEAQKAAVKVKSKIKELKVEFDSQLKGINKYIEEKTPTYIKELTAPEAYKLTMAKYHKFYENELRYRYDKSNEKEKLAKTEPHVLITKLEAGFSSAGFKGSIDAEIKGIGWPRFEKYLERDTKIKELQMRMGRGRYAREFKTAYIHCASAQESVENLERVRDTYKLALEEAKKTRNVEKNKLLALETTLKEAEANVA